MDITGQKKNCFGRSRVGKSGNTTRVMKKTNKLSQKYYGQLLPVTILFSVSCFRVLSTLCDHSSVTLGVVGVEGGQSG